MCAIFLLKVLPDDIDYNFNGTVDKSQIYNIVIFFEMDLVSVIFLSSTPI